MTAAPRVERVPIQPGGHTWFRWLNGEDRGNGRNIMLVTLDVSSEDAAELSDLLNAHEDAQDALERKMREMDAKWRQRQADAPTEFDTGAAPPA